MIDVDGAGKRVVVGMSGGVDSSVAAFLLKERGFDVVGVTLHLHDHADVVGGTRTCCSIQDVYDAQEVAHSMGIPHYNLDREDAFKQLVVQEFVDAYSAGITPSPCATCNKSVKIREMVAFADGIGADYVATGHYAVTKDAGDGYGMYKARDFSKDQTYFLSRVGIGDLRRLLCPLGGYTKDEIRTIARCIGIAVGDKRDSQDICFVPNGDYVSVLEKFPQVPFKDGLIKHIDTGAVLGRHLGLPRYTVGQRRGLGVSAAQPLYVCRIDVENNILFVGEERFLYGDTVLLKDFNFLVENPMEFMGCKLGFKVRSSADVCFGSMEALDGDLPNVESSASQGVVALQPDVLSAVFGNGLPTVLSVRLDCAVKSICPGQVCAVYCEDRLIGGGVMFGTFS